MKNVNAEILSRESEIVSSTWFKRWFNSSFYHKLYANRDENEAAEFIDGLLGELSPHHQSKMLDLGCGNGRHSKYLASKGYDVTGIDLASSSINEAKKFRTDRLQFYRHDMRKPFGKNYFDYVFNFFTSFGYFKASEEDHQVVSNIALALQPGGTLVMDYLNSNYAEKKLVAEEQKEIDGIIYKINRWTDKEHFFKKIAIEDVLFPMPEFIEQVKKFSLNDFEILFEKYGLAVQKVFGDYQLNEYNKETSSRLIIIAEKNRS